MIENAIPILKVSNLAASIHFYAEILGFSADWHADTDGDKISGLSRDGFALMQIRRCTDNYRDEAFLLYESVGFRVQHDVLVYRKNYADF